MAGQRLKKRDDDGAVEGRRSGYGRRKICRGREGGSGVGQLWRGEGNGETAWRREWLPRLVLKERELWVCCCLCRGDAGEPKMAGAMGEKNSSRGKGGGERLYSWGRREKKSKGAVWFDFGWEEDQRTGGWSSWWNQLGEKKKIRAGGGGGPLGEDKLRSFLGFFLFCVVSS